ncbi:hypothetical protein LCGC14_0434270 [marine sediment metagenome]|uniref:Uncharacterized protein n=1 Tax=marine sediment metagenome TaxID=412755 RepID=A0A0F9T596_9ZZZZ|nr:hypothetical protein [Pricia sp.]
MKKVIEALKGRKTYIVVIAVIALGALQGLGIFTMPEFAWPIIAALGLGAVRAGVDKVAKTVKESKNG